MAKTLQHESLGCQPNERARDTQEMQLRRALLGVGWVGLLLGGCVGVVAGGAVGQRLVGQWKRRAGEMR
jgi:hypothetical protein